MPKTRTSTGASSTDTTHLPGLDGLRAIAIGLVLFCHGFEFGSVGHHFEFLASRAGTAGVRLFFAISGYLITCRFAEEVSRWAGRSALKAFYIRRIFRILPPLLPYFLLLAVGSALSFLAVKPKEIAAAAFFYANYFPDKSWFTSHFWSLSIEEHFYLLWAPLVALAGNRAARIVAAIVIVATALVRPLCIEHTSVGSIPRILEQTHLQLDFFMAASLLALLLREEKFHAFLSGYVKTRILIWLVALLSITSAVPNSYARSGIDPRTVQALLFSLLVVLPTLQPRFWATRWLEHPVPCWVGRRSYGIYVWQQLILAPRAAPLSTEVTLFFVHCAIVLVIAELSYRLLERPLMARGRELARVAANGTARKWMATTAC